MIYNNMNRFQNEIIIYSEFPEQIITNPENRVILNTGEILQHGRKRYPIKNIIVLFIRHLVRKLLSLFK